MALLVRRPRVYRPLAVRFFASQKGDVNTLVKAYTSFRAAGSTFWEGTKALYSDFKTARSIRDRYNVSGLDGISRQEYRIMSSSTFNLLKVSPLVAWFALPGVGIFGVVFAYALAPKVLLSHHFWSPDQRVKFLLEDQRNIVEMLPKVANELTSHPSFTPTVAGGLSDVFLDGHRLSLASLSKDHVRHLSALYGYAPFLPTPLLRWMLRRRASALAVDDYLLLREGYRYGQQLEKEKQQQPASAATSGDDAAAQSQAQAVVRVSFDSLSPETLLEACVERGLDVRGDPTGTGGKRGDGVPARDGEEAAAAAPITASADPCEINGCNTEVMKTALSRWLLLHAAYAPLLNPSGLLQRNPAAAAAVAGGSMMPPPPLLINAPLNPVADGSSSGSTSTSAPGPGGEGLGRKGRRKKVVTVTTLGSLDEVETGLRNVAECAPGYTLSLSALLRR